MKAKIDLEKFICSYIKWNNIQDALKDQGLKCWNGEIVEIPQESEDERIKKSIIKFLIDVNNGAYTKSELEIASWIDWLEKQDEKKPVDKVEPKFKNGQWIVFNGLTLYVNEVVQGYYRTTSIGGIPNSYDWNIDNAARLWTIQDAKDGDVLAYNNSSTEIILLFNKWMGSVGKGAYSYAHTFDNKILFNDWSDCGYAAHPATKEQRELLFSKMHEAGYEWDSDKKELKEIKKTSMWTEEDEKNWRGIMYVIEENKDTAPDYDIETYDGFISWLDNIKQRMEE